MEKVTANHGQKVDLANFKRFQEYLHYEQCPERGHFYVIPSPYHVDLAGAWCYSVVHLSDKRRRYGKIVATWNVDKEMEEIRATEHECDLGHKLDDVAAEYIKTQIADIKVVRERAKVYRTIDRQKYRLYNWEENYVLKKQKEWEDNGGKGEPEWAKLRTRDEMVAFILKLHNKFGLSAPDEIQFGTEDGDSYCIRLQPVGYKFSRSHMRFWIAIHEFAHALSPIEMHDEDQPEHGQHYTRCYIELLSMFFGWDKEDMLKSAMAKPYKLRVYPKWYNYLEKEVVADV